MELITPLHIPDYAFPLDYNSRVMLTGSCFTTHLGEQLRRHKFHTLYNHAGVVFDAMGIAAQLQQVIKRELVSETVFSGTTVCGITGITTATVPILTAQQPRSN